MPREVLADKAEELRLIGCQADHAGRIHKTNKADRAVEQDAAGIKRTLHELALQERIDDDGGVGEVAEEIAKSLADLGRNADDVALRSGPGDWRLQAGGSDLLYLPATRLRSGDP